MIDAGTSGSAAAAGSSAALLDGFHPGIAVSIAIAGLGAAVTLIPLLGRFVPPAWRSPRVETRAGLNGLGAAGLGSAAPSREPQFAGHSALSLVHAAATLRMWAEFLPGIDLQRLRHLFIP